MKKTLFIAFGILFFTSFCFAQDYYATVSHQIKDNTGTTFVTYAITRTPNEEECKKVLIQKGQLQDKALINIDCFTGQTADDLFKDIFSNKPRSMLYISFADLNGYQTRTYIKMLTSSEGSAPAPTDIPVESATLWANTTIKSLEGIGIKDAKIIYPSK
ncbi:MAG: hypothetical protein Q7K98_01650 [Candidatus Omnitrophota bacterium]|nr:hypothetical protein [Candidatus Omnitrophota bacterium]